MNHFIQTAKKAVMEAGKLLRVGFLKQHVLHYKVHRYAAPVTDVDLASEAKIRSIIRRAHPDHAILGEEHGMMHGHNSPYLWIVDPIDGTNNYAHGLPFFNVTIALQKNGHTLLGAVYQPLVDELFFAVRDRGAWLNAKRAHVSKEQNLHRAYGFIEWLPDDPIVNAKGLDILTRLRRKRGRIRNIGSGALVFSYVGVGRAEYAVSVDSKLWDVAAASLFIQEAGGRVTDFHGRDPEHVWKKNPLATSPLLVTNGKIHRQILQIIR